VRAAPIPDLTERLVNLDEGAWQGLLRRLRATGLIAPASTHAPDEVDAHPLVREHFGAEVREKHPEAWRAGHSRLYEHFKAVPEKDQPDTLEEMAPLFQAVFHGCQADRYQEALDEVYWARIQRHGQGYVAQQLGAFGADLAALAGFFDPPWEPPVASITEADQAFVVGEAGYRLRALGRFMEAVASMRVALDMTIEQKDRYNAPIRAGNLSELQLTLGEVAKAIAVAEQSVDYADRSGDAFHRMSKRTTLADALHQAGDRARAEELFQKAECLQAEWQPVYPRLYSFPGYRYCDLLLDLGRHAEVRDRAEQFFEWRVPSDSLLTMAFDHLSLGRAELLAYNADGSGDLAEAGKHLNQAVDGLRKAGQIEFVGRGLLGRAAYFRATKRYDFARRDLDEAMRIATRSGMRLHECDAYLELARLKLAQGNRKAARAHLAPAAELIAATGYHRRDEDIAELKAAFG
jgi:tetratricopeptide (TPR) repeat protein